MEQLQPDHAEIEAPICVRPSHCQSCPVRNKSICGSLSTEELSHLAAATRFINIAADQTLFMQGSEATSLYSVVEGVMRLTRLLPDGRRQIIGFVFSGGFMGLSVRGQNDFTAEAITDVKACQISRAHLAKSAALFPNLELKILELAETELDAARDHIVLLGRKTANERIAQFLYDLARNSPDHNTTPWALQIPMSREDIADYLGLTIETVSRCVSHLKHAGIIEMRSPKQLIILQPKSLAKQAGIEL